MEKSLSVDNLFVFLMIFEYFKVPEPYTQRVLKWGILSALVLRVRRRDPNRNRRVLRSPHCHGRSLWPVLDASTRRPILVRRAS